MNPFFEKVNNDTLIIIGMILIALFCVYKGYNDIALVITGCFAGYMQGKNG